MENVMREHVAKGTRVVKIIHGNGQGVMRKVAYEWIKKNACHVTQHEDVGPAVIVYLKRS